MSERKRIIIPDNSAGRLAFDVFRSIAIKMWAAGDEATSDFTLTNFPAAETISKEYADRKFKRIVESGSGFHIAVVYDYKTQTTAAAQVQRNENAKRTSTLCNYQTKAVALI